jgi:hypothetical protein
MGFLIVIFSLILAAGIVMLISGPLRAAQEIDDSPSAAGGREEGEDDASTQRRAELEAAREAKYREIRDAELDSRTGKLSEADYGAIDGQLRAEALEILNQLEPLSAGEQTDGPAAEAAES